MDIVVSGANGRMGRRVCEMLEGDAVFKFDMDSKVEEIKQAELVIDFSTSTNREEIIDFASKKRIPYACFSTGLQKNDLLNFQKLSQEVPVLLCENSSLGMKAMAETTEIASKILKDADVVLQEYHHKAKKDAPSGTAKRLLEILNNKNVCVQFCRVGKEVGTHKIQFFLEDEVFEICHRVNSRDVFARGAIVMAKRLLTAKSGLYRTI